MKLSRRAIFTIICLTALVGLVVMLCMQRNYVWDRSRGYNKGGKQPYDLALFDELMQRSLPNGYAVYHPDPVKSHEDANVSLDNLGDTPADTSLLLIAIDGVHSKTLMPKLEAHAKKGGKSLVAGYSVSLKTDYGWISSDDPQIWEDKRIYTNSWLGERRSGPLALIDEKSDTLMADKRYVVDYITQDYYDANEKGKIKMHCYVDARDSEGYPCQVMATLTRGDTDQWYLMDIYYPESGGHIYMTTLDLYFCNLGVRLPEGPELISGLMGRIDDRPVKRWMYPKVPKASGSRDTETGAVMQKIADEPPLAFAWLLLIVGVCLWLASGLLRRYPVARGAEIDQLDKTDAVAVREYQFRHSPLLHFIFQCSWLYKGTKDYTELFDIDFRHLSRVVSRITGTDLREASDHDIKVMAEILAGYLHMKGSDVVDELTWMRDLKQSGAEVSPQQYRRAHGIVEKYGI